MDIIRCKRCNAILRSEKSRKLGYGNTCYRITKLLETKKHESINNSILEELLTRVRKLELDNNFMKHQLKHKTFFGKSKDSKLDFDIPKEIKEVRDTMKIEFNVVIKELNIIFKEDFDYHDILKPVNGRTEPETPAIVIENWELIY